jgi:hypothetical protein
MSAALETARGAGRTADGGDLLLALVSYTPPAGEAALRAQALLEDSGVTAGDLGGRLAKLDVAERSRLDGPASPEGWSAHATTALTLARSEADARRLPAVTLETLLLALAEDERRPRPALGRGSAGQP